MDYEKKLLEVELDIDDQIRKLNSINIEIMDSAMNIGEGKCFNYIDYIINELKICKSILENTDPNKIEKTDNANVCYS